MQVGSCFFSMMSLFCGLVYFIHFNFAMPVLKLVHFIVLVAYPVVGLVVNLIVANNLKYNILNGADELAENAEFLDFEDDEDDILRKAKIATVTRKVTLQRYAMTPMILTGCFKMLPSKDFPM